MSAAQFSWLAPLAERDDCFSTQTLHSGSCCAEPRQLSSFSSNLRWLAEQNEEGESTVGRNEGHEQGSEEDPTASSTDEHGDDEAITKRGWRRRRQRPCPRSTVALLMEAVKYEREKKRRLEWYYNELMQEKASISNETLPLTSWDSARGPAVSSCNAGTRKHPVGGTQKRPRWSGDGFGFSTYTLTADDLAALGHERRMQQEVPKVVTSSASSSTTTRNVPQSDTNWRAKGACNLFCDPAPMAMPLPLTTTTTTTPLGTRPFSSLNNTLAQSKEADAIDSRYNSRFTVAADAGGWHDEPLVPDPLQPEEGDCDSSDSEVDKWFCLALEQPDENL